MEDSDGSGELKWLIGVIIILGILWLGLGGPDRERSKQGPFLTFGINGETRISQTSGGGTGGSRFTGGSSIYSGKVLLGKGTATSRDRRREYLKLEANSSNAQAINISNWIVRSTITGVAGVIGKGAQTPIAGVVNRSDNILLAPGQTAIVSSASSPVGSSFLINKCTGYLDQFQSFTPSLSRECPRPENENISVYGITVFGLGSTDYDVCVDFLKGISQCRLVSTARPGGFTECKSLNPDVGSIDCVDFDACREFVNKEVNYNACVDSHFNDQNFFGDEWRIFLGGSDELWRRDNEIIMLIDEFGEVVDVVSY